MIPLRVTMQGWMRYREEQVADFSGARLISICGDNGAGKSSIFDAMTFALYGAHRLGRQNTEQLISQGMDLLSVSFEFEVNGVEYRVHRSAGRRSADGTRALYFRDTDSGEWATVSGSERRETLDQLIASIVHMSEAAFTSSFLLQQGEATKFLDAKPSDRFKVISSLIGLAAYERLGQLASDAHRETRGALANLTTLLAEYAGADEAALATLHTHLAVAEQERARAQEAVLAAAVRAQNAETYAARMTDIAALGTQIAQADDLIARREVIEQEARAHENAERDAAIVRRIGGELAAEEAALTSAVVARLAADAIDVVVLEAAATSASRLSDAAAIARDAAASALSVAQSAESTAAARLTVVESIEGSRALIVACDERIAASELQLGAMDDANAEAARLAQIRDILPLMRALKESIEAHEMAVKVDPAVELARLIAERDELVVSARSLAAAVAVALAAQQQVQQARADADAKVQSLAAEVRAREAASAEATCSRCGQPVDRKRAQAEVAALKKSGSEALARAKLLAVEFDEAEKALKAAQSDESGCTERQTALVVAIGRAEDAVAAAESAAALVVERRAAVVGAAPADIASAVAEAAGVPEIAGIVNAHRDAAKQAKAAQDRLDALNRIAGERDATRSQRAAAEKELRTQIKNVGDIDLDPATARADHVTSAAAFASAKSAFDAAIAAAQSTAAADKAAADRLVAARSSRVAHEQAAATAAAEATGRRRAAEAHASALPADLRADALAEPARIADGLDERAGQLGGAPARLAELAGAIESRAGWLAQRADRQSAADAVPEQHRVDAEEARASRDRAAAESQTAVSAAQAADREVVTMVERLTQCAELRQKQTAAALRLKRLARLRTLLGKSGLQGALVTDALTAITSHANGFLTRLTGGSLQLVLKRSATSDALELQAIDSTCMRDPIDVLALSGSQKFRCAVAVASGIGQFSGAGGMRSIVIDEGFSSLDEESQLQMVDELKQLATHMEKVIVVSHLAPYKDPDNFPDQILVETRGEGSIVHRRS